MRALPCTRCWVPAVWVRVILRGLPPPQGPAVARTQVPTPRGCCLLCLPARGTLSVKSDASCEGDAALRTLQAEALAQRRRDDVRVERVALAGAIEARRPLRRTVFFFGASASSCSSSCSFGVAAFGVLA